MEKYRPQFHFTPAQNWMNDPNGLIYFMGEYHLFYQHNPFNNQWGHMSWGHAVSYDLVHWRHLPVALAEENDEMAFSGCSVIDWKNTSGFGKPGQPPIVAIYTGRPNSDGRQYQCIAYSNNKGRTFTKYAGNPVIDIESDNFRDPKVFWYEPLQKWVMLVAQSVEKKICFYDSQNLKDWRKISEFKIDSDRNEKWECPDFFRLKIDDDPQKNQWVMVISTIPEPNIIDSGSQYFFGEFDGYEFVLSKECSIQLNNNNKMLKVDFGKDFYAASTWAELPASDGRKIWVGWMNNWEYADQTPTQPWKGAQSIPRELQLKTINNTIKLIQKPVAELTSLRTKPVILANKTMDEINSYFKDNEIDGLALEIIAEFLFEDSAVFGIKIAKGESEETVIGYDAVYKEIYFDRTKSGAVDFNPYFTQIQKAKYFAQNKIVLHVLIDKSSVEIFVNNGEVVFTNLIFPKSASKGVEFFVSAGKVSVAELKIWELNSIWE